MLLEDQNSKISNSWNIPDFVNDNHPKFVAFLESYYEWLEQRTNPYGRTQFLQELADVDDIYRGVEPEFGNMVQAPKIFGLPNDVDAAYQQLHQSSQEAKILYRDLFNLDDKTPISKTIFATDKIFGYETSNLKNLLFQQSKSQINFEVNPTVGVGDQFAGS